MSRTSILPTAASLVEKLPRVLRRHRLMTTWMRLTGEPPLQLVRIRDDSFGYADMSDGFLRLIVIEKAFEKDFFSIADTLLDGGGTFFDVGANHGLFSFGLAGRHGASIDFHLFEPNPKLVDSIEKTRALYPAMRMRLAATAVSDAPGSVSFEINEGQTGVSHVTASGEGIEVPAITLGDYIRDAGVHGVDLVKIDVEGYELAVLRGGEADLRKRTIKAVWFEYFEGLQARFGSPRDVLQFLDGVGFEVCLARPCDYGPRGGVTHACRGVAVLPLFGAPPPAMTDLLAVPKEDVVAI